ncbi:hypothetical protein, partial [Sulfitobacter sp. 15WGC]|uniref:hypothetical protein n=1 Tax=Sulfitobacter sp. 15WGC TaxID=2575437 RepID=UPI001B7F875C
MRRLPCRQWAAETEGFSVGGGVELDLLPHRHAANGAVECLSDPLSAARIRLDRATDGEHHRQ